jgi:hypothetical protein
MTELPGWVPEGVDVDVPNAARIYDALLGGHHNFVVDREAAAHLEHAAPGSTAIARSNRAFVGRSVRWLTDAGIRQFLDLGSGIPSLGNVHDIAQGIAPHTRVVYVDTDPVAVAHGTAILADNPLTATVLADVRRPADVLGHPDVTRLLDFTQPAAVLFNAVLHFVSDADDPPGIVARFRAALADGSYLTLSHGTPVHDQTRQTEDATEVYRRTPTSIHLRTRDELAAMLSGMTLIEPGIVPVTDWHPELADADGERPIPGVLGVVARRH